MDYIDLVKWPAMALTGVAAWLMGSRSAMKRNVGFWVFLISNVLWVVRGWHVRAYALILPQVCLALLNIRGAQKTDPADAGTT
jgi:hypothetical protein